MTCCPNCGYRHANNDYAEELDRLSLPRIESDLVLRLRQAKGAVVHRETLIDFIYSDQPDGGPDTASNCLWNVIGDVRKKVSPLGWSIKTEHGRGYRLVRATQ